MEPTGGTAINPARYSKFMSTLHWLMAALVILTYITSEGDLNTHSDTPTVHILLGLSVLTLTLPRLLWRLLVGVPSPLDTFSKRWTRMAAIGHATLSMFLFAVPLTGWITLSRLGLNVELFGIMLPLFSAPVHREPGLIANVHQFGSNLLMHTVALHPGFPLAPLS